jgi:hypothetical protein
MSVGFRAAQPPPPPLEFLLWRVTKDTRTAEARVRVMAHGRELRVTVADPAKHAGEAQLFFSRLFRDGEGEALGIESTSTLENFVSHGWTLDPDTTPWHA